MIKDSRIPRIPLQLSQGCVVASIQIDLTEEVLQQFRQDLLDFLYQTHAKGFILDLSGVKVMDYEDFQAIDATLSMVSIMGAKTILTGFQPGVVSALVDFNAELDRIQATLNLDDAFELMKNLYSDTSSLFDEEDEQDLEAKLEDDSQNHIIQALEENLEDNGSV